MLYGVFASIAIAGLAQLENQGRVRVGKVWVFLGAASYCIYLVHYPVLTLAGRAVAHFPWVPTTAVWGVLVIVSAGSGALFHWLYERHLFRFLSCQFSSLAAKEGGALAPLAEAKEKVGSVGMFAEIEPGRNEQRHSTGSFGDAGG